MIRPFPYGFLLAKGEVPFEGSDCSLFEQVSLGMGFKLYRRPDEPFSVSKSSDVNVVVLGHPYIVKNKLSLNEIAECFLESINRGWDHFFEILDDVGGRWAAIIIQRGEVRAFNDVFGLQPVYFGKNSILLSSHLPLIRIAAEALGHELNDLNPTTQYFLWPETEDSGIGAVSPNFYYSSRDSSLHRFYPRKPNRFANVSLERLADSAAELMKESASQIGSFGSPLFCAFTGGRDSRLTLAALLSAGLDPNLLTYGSKAEPSSTDGPTMRSYKKDVRITTRIAADLKLKHRVLAIEDAPLAKLSDEDIEILNGNTLGKHARRFQGLYEGAIGNLNPIQGVGVGGESVIDYFSNKISPIDERRDFEYALRAVGGLSEAVRGKRPEIPGFSYSSAWREYGYDVLASNGFSTSNFIYWELRAGRFQSQALNCQLTASLPMTPFGVRGILERGMAYPREQRLNSSFVQDLIARLFPPLLGYPFNSESGYARVTFELSETKKRPSIISNSSRSKRQVLRQPMDRVIATGENHLNEGNAIFFEAAFGLVQGTTLIGYRAPWSIGKSCSNIVIFVSVNGKDVLTDPIGMRNNEVFISLDGLERGDLVRFGLRSTKDNGPAWKNLGRLNLVKWEEFDQWTDWELRVRSTSATAEILDESEKKNAGN